MEGRFTLTDFINNNMGKVVRKTYTFSGQNGVVNIFNTSGFVRTEIVAIVNSSLSGTVGCTIDLGFTNDPDAMISGTAITSLTLHTVWLQRIPGGTIEPASLIRDYVSNANQNIVIDISGTINSGSIEFVCFYVPLSANARVTPV